MIIEKEVEVMAGRIEGKVAVVTGGCSGIGLAVVQRFAAEGAKVVIGDVDDVKGPTIAEQVGGTYVHVDVTDKRQVDALFKTAFTTYGSVDIAFNNAGISPPEDASILDTELEAWKRVQEVNLTSVYLCCKAALPYMLEQKSGSIINTASFVAVMGAATSQISYSAVEKPAYWRIVQGRLAYMVARTPRVNGGKPGSVSVSRPSMSAAVYSALTSMSSGRDRVRESGERPFRSLAARAVQSSSVGSTGGLASALIDTDPTGRQVSRPKAAIARPRRVLWGTDQQVPRR